jgi:ketosteroid isomerase-like protein
MNPAVRYVFTLLIAFATSAHLLAADKGIEAEVLRQDAARIAALQQADIPALERLYSDQLVYIHANGRIDTKEGYLKVLRAGDLSYSSITYDPPAQVRIVENTAIVTGRASIDAKGKGGKAMKRILTTTTVYVRTAAGWKVVSYQGTPAT